MATSLLFKALSDQNHNSNNDDDNDDDQNMRMKPLCEETNKGGGVGRRRKSQGKGPKKQPQRGLGVEQLERLRMQETLMKMNETCGGFPTLPFTSRSTCVPVKYAGGVPNHVQGVIQCPNSQQVVLNGNSVGVWGQGGHFIVNNNRSGGVGVGASSGVCGVGLAVPNNNQMNRVSSGSYGFGAPLMSPSFVGSGPLETTSKELSSMPNVHFEPQCFDACLNKKSRFNEANAKGSYSRRDMSFEIWPNSKVPDFLGLIPEAVASNVVSETNDFYNKLARHDPASAYAANNVDESVEIVAVHRKGNSRVFMEYEFFPGKDGIGTSSKELELATNVGVGAAEASPITAASYGDPTASKYIDLSLKLSH
ncbi:hypothetical protein RIF29_39243 [Crotalaria pallida]|uniref:Uncharacterized protein n=1 Tax=Crotalaria pallida TaxID=3830 RepID=A0AAN9E3A3_CROPI